MLRLYKSIVIALLVTFTLSICDNVYADVTLVEGINENALGQLVWHDEFDGESLDESKWRYNDYSYRYGSSWPGPDNAEKECFDLKDGALVIKTRYDWDTENNKIKQGTYKSTKIFTGQLAHFQYGHIEIRAKLAKGQGAMSDVWLKGTENAWPVCGEIDIFGKRKESNNKVWQAIFNNAFNGITNENGIKNATTELPEMYSEYHTYGVIWTTKNITFTIDGKVTFVYNPSEYSATGDGTDDMDLWPFSKPFVLNLDGGVAKNLAGTITPTGWTKIATEGDIETYEDYFYIDYVRVYSLSTEEIEATKKETSIEAYSQKTTVGKSFSIDAQTNGDGKLSYESSNKKILSIDGNGQATAKKSGKVKVTIKSASTEQYRAATKTITVKVVPKQTKIKSVKSIKPKRLTVIWKKNNHIVGYQMALSTKKDFSGDVKKRKINKSKTKIIINGLKQKKIYYIKIRAYDKNETGRYYGAWSKVWRIKIKGGR